MRVVAYVRESADPTEDRFAFAQQEDVRRHAAAHSLQVVALCQDLRTPGRPLGRDGYLSLLGVLASGNVEAVLLPGAATLSADVVVQEILLWDLRSRGVRVLSTDPADLDLLGSAPADPTRQFVRDVLARVAEYGAFLATTPAPAPPAAAAPVDDDGVVVRLVSSADAAEVAEASP